MSGLAFATALIPSRAAARNVASVLLGVVFPVLLTAAMFAARGRGFAYDFHHAFWPAGRDVLAGVSPYVSPGSQQIADGVAFVYPAPAALLLAPFALLGRAAADDVFTTLNIACALLALRLLRVRDWRLYGFVLLTPPVLYGWQLGNVTLPLMLGAAGVWRWRDRPATAGVLLALLVSIKLFLWPLAIWLLATRRYAAAAYMLIATVAFNLAAWPVLGVAQLGRYRDLLQAVTRHEERNGYSVISVALRLGADRTLAYAALAALAVAGAGACFALGRRAHEPAALAAALALCLVASPIVWLPYFTLIVIPLAIYRPTLGRAWWLLMATWVCPITDPNAAQLAVALAVAGALLVAILDGAHGGPLRAVPKVPQTTADRRLLVS